MSVPRTEVLVVGGGVIGVAVADAVAFRGIPVVVLERAQVASAASAGAAGMLAALVEARSGPFLDLLLAGRDAIREEAEVLRRETGVDTGYRETGTLRVAEDGAVAAMLRERVVQARERDLGVRWVERDELRRMEPALRPDLVGALFSLDDHQVTSALLAHALARRASARGAAIVEGLGVERLLRVNGGVIGVRTTAGEEYRARLVVLAAGPWSAALVGGAVPVAPVKGQLVRLRPERPVIGHPISAGGIYLVPKPDGRLLVGATEEDAGFDWSPRDAATRDLVERACALVPALKDAPLEGAWAGLRPATPDRLPVIGMRRDMPGLVFATGHFRNGILLSLLTGRIVASLVAGEPPPVDVSAFSPERFG